MPSAQAMPRTTASAITSATLSAIVVISLLIPTHIFADALEFKLPPFLDNLLGLEAKRAARREAERRAKLFIIGPIEIRKRVVYYGIVVLIAVIIQFGPVFVAYLCSDKRRNKKKRLGNRPGKNNTLDVVVVGCGLPKKGMGWFHLIQLLDMPNVNVRAVVEPFYFNNRPKIFDNLIQSLQERGVVCVASVADLKRFQKRTLCLVAGRTNNNPILLRQCIENGASAIYTEQPGAPTIKQLEDIKATAKEKGLPVYIGYNNNVARYIQNAVKLSRQVDNSHVFMCHNDSYSEDDLPQVFSRNPEGLMKNMVIHEFVVLITYFGVRLDNITRFGVNAKERFTKKMTVRKPRTSSPTKTPTYITDFSRVAFKITTKDDTSVSVMADRCGGNISFAVVKDENGREVQKFDHPNALAAKKLEKQISADPDMKASFFIHSDSYLELKKRVVAAVLDEKEAEGVATIDIGIEAMRLAEYATKKLIKSLEMKAPPEASPG